MAYDRRIIYTELDEDTHRTLLALCSLRGQNINTVAAELLQEALARESEKDYACGEDLIDLRVYAGVQRVRRQARLRTQLCMIAFEHNQFPTEETADLLTDLCNLAGVAKEEIIKDSEDQRVPLVQDNGTGVGSAVRWLQAFLGSQEMPMVQVMEAGHRMGFSPATIRAAKTQLNIHSYRRANCWVWVKQSMNTVSYSELPSSS